MPSDLLHRSVHLARESLRMQAAEGWAHQLPSNSPHAALSVSVSPVGLLTYLVEGFTSSHRPIVLPTSGSWGVSASPPLPRGPNSSTAGTHRPTPTGRGTSTRPPHPGCLRTPYSTVGHLDTTAPAPSYRWGRLCWEQRRSSPSIAPQTAPAAPRPLGCRGARGVGWAHTTPTPHPQTGRTDHTQVA